MNYLRELIVIITTCVNGLLKIDYRKGAVFGLGIRRWVGHGFLPESFHFYIPMSEKIGSTWICNQVTQKDG